jgi:hypothetical protein
VSLLSARSTSRERLLFAALTELDEIEDRLVGEAAENSATAARESPRRGPIGAAQAKPLPPMVLARSQREPFPPGMPTIRLAASLPRSRKGTGEPGMAMAHADVGQVAQSTTGSNGVCSSTAYEVTVDR